MFCFGNLNKYFLYIPNFITVNYDRIKYSIRLFTQARTVIYYATKYMFFLSKIRAQYKANLAKIFDIVIAEVS